MPTTTEMPMLKLLHLAFMMFLVLGLPKTAVASCGSASAHKEQEDLSWVKSDKVIYAAKGGKIFQTKFNTHELFLLADHKFDYISSFQLYPNVRYIYYQGFSKDRGFQDYLYDINLKRDLALNLSDYRLEGANLNSVEFSPDGSKLAWITNSSKLGSHKIVIRSLDQSKETIVDYLLDSIATQDYRFTELKWSLGSDALFLATIAFPDNVYFKYTLATNELLRIDGRHHPFHDYKDLGDYGFHFSVSGQEQPFYKPACLQWQCQNQGKARHGASAVIDEKYNLVLKIGDKEKVVDKGTYSQCEGVTIRILSWLEDGAYLVYQISGTTYIYGLAEDKTAKLFEAGDIEFGWQDYENREQSSFP